MLASPFAQVAAFASTLWEQDDLIELRALGGNRVASDWVQAKELQRESGAQAWIKRHRDDQFNIYAGVNPRKGRGGKDAASVALARCFFVDFDGPSFSESSGIIKDSGLPEPTLGIESGHGSHAYWRLIEPLADLSLWTRYQKRLIGILGSDAKIHDPPRIMRVPGTTNWKDEPPVECRIVFESGCRFKIPDLGIEPVPESGGYIELGPSMDPGDGWAEMVKRSTLVFCQSGAKEGERNGSLFNAACDMAGAGVPRGKAETLLVPPARRSGLEDWEIERTISSAYGKPRTAPTIGGGGYESPWVASVPGVTPNVTNSEIVTPHVTTNRAEGIKAARSASRPTISNVASKQVKDEDGDVKTVLIYKPVDQFAAELGEVSGLWPRSVAGMLFAPKPLRPNEPIPGMAAIWMIAKADTLVSWFHDVADVHWVDARGGVVDAVSGTSRSPFTKGEFFEWMRSHAFTEYRGIAVLPHEPAIPGVYYCPSDLPKPTGKHLRELLDHLNPDSEIDRALLLASICTPGWGGEPGTRPAFMFCSAHGRGVGKTATVTAIAELLWGGVVTIKPEEEFQKVIGRLLGDGGLGTRCVLWDNIKGRQDCAGMDALLTARTIDGWRPHYGQFSRVNDLTYFGTATHPRLSEDLTVRSVVIQIGPHRHGIDFIGWASAFIREHRAEILADIYELLRGPIAVIPSGMADRFPAWQGEVLGRSVAWLGMNFGSVLEEVKARRSDVNDDEERADAVAEAIEGWLKAKMKVGEIEFITRDQMAELLVESKVIDDKGKQMMGVQGMNTMVRNLTGKSGPLARLEYVTRRRKVDGAGVRSCWAWHRDGPPKSPQEGGNGSTEPPAIDRETGDVIPF